MEGITDIKITNRIAKERKFGKMMAIIISLFFISYGPTYLLKQVKLRIITFLFIFAIVRFQLLEKGLYQYHFLHLDSSTSDKDSYC